MSADATAAATTRSQWNWYLQQYAPLEEQLVGDIDSTALIDNASEAAALQTEVGNQSLGRSLDRYGVGNMPGAQKERLERQQALGNATNTAQAVNTARIDQRERNLGLASDLMQKGRGVASSAIDGMGQAANMEASRNAANAQAKAQAKANNVSTAIGLASLAMMIPW